MPKYIIFFLLFVSTIFAEYNDTIVNYIFENRNVWQKYFQKKEYNWMKFLLDNKNYEKENVWQKESLFTANANINSYYKYKKEIIRSIQNNRVLSKESAYFNVILPLIKEEQLDIYFLKGKIPFDVLAKNKDSIKNLLYYFMQRDSLRWNDEKYRNKYDNYKGYAEYAVLAQLDSVYNYKMISFGILASKIF